MRSVATTVRRSVATGLRREDVNGLLVELRLEIVDLLVADDDLLGKREVAGEQRLRGVLECGGDEEFISIRPSRRT